jgi:hypothetical protein
VTVFQQGASNSSQTVTDQPPANPPLDQNAPIPAPTEQTFVIEIKGTGLNPAGHRVLVFPATGVQNPTELSSSDTAIWEQFSAPPGYAPQEVAISLADGSIVPGTVTNATCDFDKDVSTAFTVVPVEQAKNKYGNGVAEDFHVVQISIVNKCPTAIIVPLAGIRVGPRLTPTDENQSAVQKDNSNCQEVAAKLIVTDNQKSQSNIPLPCNVITPLSLDHVTSIYSTDRKLTGRRAIYFNSLLAAVTLAGSIEPFFGKSFGRVYAQGVSIAGGAFTTASKEVFIDMSAEQLQNIVSQSFNSTEQVGPSGSLQKFVFLPNWCNFPILRRPGTAKECQNNPIQQALLRGDFDLYLEILPASSQSGTQKVSPAAKNQQTNSSQPEIAPNSNTPQNPQDPANPPPPPSGKKTAGKTG